MSISKLMKVLLVYGRDKFPNLYIIFYYTHV